MLSVLVGRSARILGCCSILLSSYTACTDDEVKTGRSGNQESSLTCASTEHCTDSLCDCGSGDACGVDGLCIESASCTASCGAAGFECGDLCGTSCGTCSGSDVCFKGQCSGEADVSCLGCSLRLIVLDKQVASDKLTQVTLAIDYLPQDGEPQPRMADFRVLSNRSVTVTAAAAQAGLVDTSKSLYIDPATSNPWRQRADGAIQFLALSLSNTNRITSGRLLTTTVTLDSPSAAFWIAKRDQTFAPPDADQAIGGTDFDAPVVVLP